MGRCCGDDPVDSQVFHARVDRSVFELMDLDVLRLLLSSWQVMEIDLV